MVIVTGVFTMFLAIVFAAIEIEAEGKHGWAEHMPTWYRTTGAAAKVYGFFMQKKPLTGYHAWMFFLPIMMFHFPFVFGTEWSITQEARAWILYLTWSPLWDYFWFVLNPEYGVKGFKKERVWWHAKSNWILNRMPVDYLFAWIAAIIVALVANDIDWTLTLLGVYIISTVLLILLSPVYHKWYRMMRTSDDRPQADIFH